MDGKGSKGKPEVDASEPEDIEDNEEEDNEEDEADEAKAKAKAEGDKPMHGPHPLGIPKVLYDADFLLLDRYQKFTAELLRLALLGFGAVGFFVEKLHLTDGSRFTQIVVVLALFAFAISVVGALGHRYYSSDGMHYHLRAIRFPETKPPPPKEGETPPPPLNTGKKPQPTDRESRASSYKFSGKCLGVSAISFGVGAIFVGLAFAAFLYSPPKAVTQEGSASVQPK